MNVAVLIVACLLSAIPELTESQPESQEHVEFFSIRRFSDSRDGASSAPEGFFDVFTKQIDVFGVKLYATKKTPDKKFLHAANILAEYLDNDADGKPDNEVVANALIANNAAMIMAATEREFEELEDRLIKNVPQKVIDEMVLQSLWGEETHPAGAARGVFDASLEEVLHLITHGGYAHAYPDHFGEKPGTKLANAMDKARGGQFKRVPRKYPKEAWYSYDDRTCSYGCQCTEYIYWGLTSKLGAQQFAGRGNNIRHEWKLNTPGKFQAGDTDLDALLSDLQFKFPTRLPVGKYSPRNRDRKAAGQEDLQLGN